MKKLLLASTLTLALSLSAVAWVAGPSGGLFGGYSSSQSYLAAPVPFTLAAEPADQLLPALIVSTLALLVLGVAGMNGALSDARARVASRLSSWWARVLAVLGLLTVGVAFAQGAAATAPSSDGGLQLGIFGLFAGPIFTAIAGGGVWLLGAGAKFLSQKTALVKNDRLRGALDLLDTLIFSKVTEIFQASIETLKSASADGKITKEEAGAAASTAIKEVWTSLPDLIRKLLTAAAGGSEQAAQSAYVAPRVELAAQSVNRSNASGTLAIRPFQPITSLGLTSTHDIPTLPQPTPASILAARSRIGLTGPRVTN